MMGIKREPVEFEPEEKALVQRWIKEQRTESTEYAYRNNIENFLMWYKRALICEACVKVIMGESSRQTGL
jgi:hypothetical protein